MAPPIRKQRRAPPVARNRDRQILDTALHPFGNPSSSSGGRASGVHVGRISGWPGCVLTATGTPAVSSSPRDSAKKSQAPADRLDDPFVPECGRRRGACFAPIRDSSRATRFDHPASRTESGRCESSKCPLPTQHASIKLGRACPSRKAHARRLTRMGSRARWIPTRPTAPYTWSRPSGLREDAGASVFRTRNAGRVRSDGARSTHRSRGRTGSNR